MAKGLDEESLGQAYLRQSRLYRVLSQLEKARETAERAPGVWGCNRAGATADFKAISQFAQP
jgi:hypothetical protein